MREVDKKNIYLKKIDSRDGYDIWLVNGQYVRKEINENFVAYDYHTYHHFVPPNELWIDEETNSSEHHFFIERMLFEISLLKTEESRFVAFQKAAFFEKKNREVENHKKHMEKSFHNRRLLILKIHKKVLEQYGPITVWLVDGKLVRDFLLVDFAFGGHDKVYTFIPKNEIWIEEVLFKNEQRFILVHELHERILMAKGKKYSEAHKSAILVEDYYRDHPEELEERIKKEVDENIVLK